MLALALAPSCTPSPRQASVRELMQAPIAPASDALFNAVIFRNGGLVSAPNTQAEWNTLRQHTQLLAQAGTALIRLAPEENQEVWTRTSAALADAARQSTAAVDGQNIDAVLDSGGKVFAACTACHAAFVKEGGP